MHRRCSTTSTSPWHRARRLRWSATRERASRRCRRCSRASTIRSPGACGSTGRTCAGCRALRRNARTQPASGKSLRPRKAFWGWNATCGRPDCRPSAATVPGHRAPGHLYLVDPAARTQSELIHAATFKMEHDSRAYPGCPGPLNLQAFDTHGLSLTETSPRHFSLYTTSHGAREAIEIYDLDLRAAAPSLTWKGCVLLQQDRYHNSVARLADGGFITTTSNIASGISIHVSALVSPEPPAAFAVMATMSSFFCGSSRSNRINSGPDSPP